MQRAWHCAIGLPGSCTSAAWMLGFVTPPDVSKSFKVPPRSRVDVPIDPGTREDSSLSEHLFRVPQVAGRNCPPPTQEPARMTRDDRRTQDAHVAVPAHRLIR